MTPKPNIFKSKVFIKVMKNLTHTLMEKVNQVISNKIYIRQNMDYKVFDQRWRTQWAEG
jgi:hypothetical protein